MNAENILIVEGGEFLIGSKEHPFQHKATVMLHGHVRSKELPVYGAKSLSLRHGYLGLYGKHIMHTWTHISTTVLPGDTRMNLILAVTDWKTGDEIVIASTSKSIRENEVVTITAVEPGGRTLHIDPPLKYKHISIVQTIAGRVIETRAEVGFVISQCCCERIKA